MDETSEEKKVNSKKPAAADADVNAEKPVTDKTEQKTKDKKPIISAVNETENKEIIENPVDNNAEIKKPVKVKAEKNVNNENVKTTRFGGIFDFFKPKEVENEVVKLSEKEIKAKIEEQKRQAKVKEKIIQEEVKARERQAKIKEKELQKKIAEQERIRIDAEKEAKRVKSELAAQAEKAKLEAERNVQRIKAEAENNSKKINADVDAEAKRAKMRTQEIMYELSEQEALANQKAEEIQKNLDKQVAEAKKREEELQALVKEQETLMQLRIQEMQEQLDKEEALIRKRQEEILKLDQETNRMEKKVIFGGDDANGIGETVERPLPGLERPSADSHYVVDNQEESENELDGETFDYEIDEEEFMKAYKRQMESINKKKKRTPIIVAIFQLMNPKSELRRELARDGKWLSLLNACLGSSLTLLLLAIIINLFGGVNSYNFCMALIIVSAVLMVPGIFGALAIWRKKKVSKKPETKYSENKDLYIQYQPDQPTT